MSVDRYVADVYWHLPNQIRKEQNVLVYNKTVNHKITLVDALISALHSQFVERTAVCGSNDLRICSNINGKVTLKLMSSLVSVISVKTQLDC